MNIKCNECKKIKSEQYFHKNSHNKNGYDGKCKECRLKYIHTDKYKERQRNYDLYRKYKIYEEDYQKLLKLQNNKCAICDKIVVGRLYVDHCHETGNIRGLLCQTCNSGLGLLGDKTENLIRALNYLINN